MPRRASHKWDDFAKHKFAPLLWGFLFNQSSMNFQSIAEQFGTPLYVYDKTVLVSRIEELQSTLGSYPNAKFFYAIKANFNPHIVKEIISHGFGIDAVSVDEVKMGLLCGADKENIVFTESNCTDEEMHEAVSLGVILNIGSLSRLKKFGQSYPGSRVSIRFNPNVGAASHNTNITGGPDSKFGIGFDDVEQVKAIARQYNLHIVGVHEHIGSGWLGTEEPLLALDVILNIAEQFSDLEFVDVGGGFGVPYRPDQTRLDLATLGEKMKIRFESFCQQYGKSLELRFEPGRYIVAESGHLLTRVNTLKKSLAGKTLVGTDTGMNHLVRVAMYGSYHPIVNVTNEVGESSIYDVVGNICESADFFAQDRKMAEVREGDVLDIQIAGAYGMSMASHYQFRDLPMEVLVDKDTIKIIRRRENFEARTRVFDFN